MKLIHTLSLCVLLVTSTCNSLVFAQVIPQEVVNATTVSGFNAPWEPGHTQAGATWNAAILTENKNLDGNGTGSLSTNLTSNTYTQINQVQATNVNISQNHSSGVLNGQ